MADKIYTVVKQGKGTVTSVPVENLIEFGQANSSGGSFDQENIIRVPSATYSELGISPSSTLLQKQQAISDFLQGYNNGEKDVLFFEILDDEENQGLKIIDLTN